MGLALFYVHLRSTGQGVAWWLNGVLAGIRGQTPQAAPSPHHQRLDARTFRFPNPLHSCHIVSCRIRGLHTTVHLVAVIQQDQINPIFWLHEATLCIRHQRILRQILRLSWWKARNAPQSSSPALDSSPSHRHRHQYHHQIIKIKCWWQQDNGSPFNHILLIANQCRW